MAELQVSTDVDMEDPDVPQHPAQNTNAVVFDDLRKLWNFLLFGTSSHLPDSQELQLQCKQIIDRLIAGKKGKEVVQLIQKASTPFGTLRGQDGQNHLEDSYTTCIKYPVLYALAVCIRSSDPNTKREAYLYLPKICETSSHLFLFLNLYYCMRQRKSTWGKQLRKMVQEWYHSRTPADLAIQVTKYRQRYGFSHKKVLRLAHVKPQNDDYAFIFNYVLFGYDGACHRLPGEIDVKEYLQNVEFVRKFDVKRVDTGGFNKLLEAIQCNELMWEHLQTKMLKSPSLWQPLLPRIQPMALIRNLGRLSYLGLLAPDSDTERTICGRLCDEGLIQKAKVHPLSVLIALTQYSRGRNSLGNRNWPVNQRVIYSLWSAFKSLSKKVHASKKRIMLAINVNTSMDCPVVGSSALTSKATAVFLAKLIHDIESNAGNHDVHCLNFYAETEPLNLAVMDFENLANFSQLQPSQTDFRIPFQRAVENNLLIDAFVVFTDFLEQGSSEIIQQALHDYRQHTGLQSRLIVVGLSCKDFSIDNDDYMIDLPGVDSRILYRIFNFITDDQSDIKYLQELFGNCLDIRV